MCGIAGYVGERDDELLRRMTDSLTHRGPDAGGYYGHGLVSLGHRRLSIIDLSQGQQPLFNEDRTVVVVYNGEIYNFRPLRDELVARGHRFATHTDTECIVHAYEEWGTACVERLHGMFAFVLYDQNRQRLFGARDRLGKKPLYFYERARTPGATDSSGSTSAAPLFAFASELKALKVHPGIGGKTTLSESALVSFLLNDYVVGEQSIYEEIRRLPAGSAFEFGLPGSAEPGLRVWPYWSIQVGTLDTRKSAATRQSERVVDESQAGDKLIDLLREAVSKRLMSDVPLGGLLSGGIDSSTIVALMAEFRPAAEIETFSIGFEEKSYDESEYANRVANYFGTKHRNRSFTFAELQQRLPRTIAMMDEPFADPSLLPVSLLCEFSREHVTVALGGDGGDEILAGYDPLRAVRPAGLYRRMIPQMMHRNVLVPMAKWLPTSEANMPLQFRVNRFLRGVMVPPRLRIATWMGPFSLEQLRRLMPEVGDGLLAEKAYAPILSAYAHVDEEAADSLDFALDFYQRFYLADDILVKADRASMMHSLEVRSPFLDTDVVEFANSLPESLKLRQGVSKYLLKQALLKPRRGPGGVVRPLIPREIIERPKKGFGIPVARWIRHELKDLFHATLIRDWPEQSLPMFNRWEVERLYLEHVHGRNNNYKELWALFTLALWAREHLG